jgi:nonsense-mediated mRNA decay protein 3
MSTPTTTSTTAAVSKPGPRSTSSRASKMSKRTTRSTTSRMTQVDHNILCCLCGISVPPNPANMCLNCIRSQVDITEGIPKEEVINFCRECERYLQPPKYWVACGLESKELLTICLKRIKGLQKVKLVDAKFLWTEPHSRRLKAKITIQKEVFNGTVLQQSFVVDFVVRNQQCEACQKSFTPYTWTAVVQVRQKVDHKRTFYFLEQLILKHNMHEKCINIKEEPDGMDFYFGHRSHANKFADFVSGVCPIKIVTSERLVTHDAKSNIFNFKYAFSIEMAPICREDLVLLPAKLSRDMGGLGPLVLCSKVNSKLYFLDPTNMQQGEVTSNVYWKHQFTSLMDTRRLSEFTVLDVDIIDEDSNGGQSVFNYKRNTLAEVQLAKEDDMDNIIFVKTHLGNILKPGDNVLAYDLLGGSYNENEMRDIKSESIPDALIVRKIYRRNTERNWKLRKIQNVEKSEKPDDKKKKKSSAGGDNKKNDKDYEHFLQELEEDAELRSRIDLIKVEDTFTKKKKRPVDEDAVDSDEEDDELPQIDEEELKTEEELEALRKQRQAEEEDAEEDEPQQPYDGEQLAGEIVDSAVILKEQDL